MKIAVALMSIFMVAAVAPATQDTKKTAKKAGKTSKPAAKKIEPLTIPKDAVQTGEGVYNYTDKQGQKWVYVNTPFGVTRTRAVDAEPGPAAGPAGGSAVTKAIDKGDTVQFEQPTPFGKRSWEKKKTELTDDERRILDGQQQSKPE